MHELNLNQTKSGNSGFFYGYIIVAVSFLIMTLIPGTYYSFGVFFKPMSAEFGWTRAMTSAAFSLAWIVTGFVSIAIGALNDKFGPRLVMTLCGLLSGSGYLLMSQMKEIWQLYLFYGFLVGGGLSIFVPLLSTLARWFIKRRTIMSGIIVSGIGVGALAGPLVGTWLIQLFDWRSSFIVMGSIILVIVIVSAQFLRHEPSRMGQVAYGAEAKHNTYIHAEATSFSLKKALATRQLWIGIAMFFCFGFTFNALQIHIVPYATDIGIPTGTAALILAIASGSSIFGRIALGSIGDQIGNKKSFILGFVFFVIAALSLIVSSSEWVLYLFAIFFGFAWGNLATQQSPLVAMLFGLASHGLIFGVIDLGFTFGSAVGPFISGLIYDTTGSYKIAFIISAIVSGLGIAITLMLNPMKPDPTHNQNKI